MKKFLYKLDEKIQEFKEKIGWDKIIYYSDYFFDGLVIMGGILAFIALFIIF